MIQQTALLLVAGLIFLFSFTSDSGVPDSSNPMLSVFLLLFLTFMPGLLSYFLGRQAIKHLADDRERRIIQLQNSRRFTLFFGVIGLVGFVFEVYYLKLPVLVSEAFGFFKFVNSRMLIGIIPLIITIMLTRLATFELDRQVRNTTWTRRRFFSTNLKLMLFPLLPFILFLFIGDLIDHSPISVRIFFTVNPYLYWVIMLTIVVVMYTEAPAFIRRIWITHSLPDGDIRNRIEDLARREKIKYRDVLVWGMSGGNIANAGMAGLLSFSRYVFLTDSLLENFSMDEIETVVAHEFGHIKHRHTLAYLVFTLGYLIFYVLLYIRFLPIIERMHLGVIYIAFFSAIMTILAFYTYFILIFRFLSRRFERQADLYAVESTGKPEAFKSALIKLSTINYIPRHASRLIELIRTHPSVSRRLEFVNKAVRGDKNTLKYRKPFFHAVGMSILVAIVLLVLLVSSRKALFPAAEMQYEVGRQYAIEGMIDEAIVMLRDAERIDPGSARVHYALGILYAEKGIMDKAVKELERTLEINPQNTAARKKLKQIRDKLENDSKQPS